MIHLNLKQKTLNLDNSYKENFKKPLHFYIERLTGFLMIPLQTLFD